MFLLHWDHTALAWATAVGLMLNFATLYLCMRKFANGLETKLLTSALARLAVAVAVMAAICLVAKMTVMSDWSHMGFVMRVVALGGSISVAGAAYFALTAKMGVEESSEFLSLLGRRFGRK